MKIFILLIISLLSGCFICTQAQETPLPRHKIGFLVSYGTQRFSEWCKIDQSYRYEAWLFQGQYYYTIIPKKKWTLEILLQPQYNRNRYEDLGIYTRKGHEFGLNAGILLRKYFLKNQGSVYLLVSAGPHFVSGTPYKRQAKGFIFSDNFQAGLNCRLFKKLSLDLRTGFRHLSNAGLQAPNRGLNNLLLNGGFLVDL